MTQNATYGVSDSSIEDQLRQARELVNNAKNAAGMGSNPLTIQLQNTSNETLINAVPLTQSTGSESQMSSNDSSIQDQL